MRFKGFGNVRYRAAEILEELGSKIIAVSGVKRETFNEKGLKVSNVLEHCRKPGYVLDYSESENITNAELLELSCDFLIPAALEGQITRQNAGSIKTKMVVKGANGPAFLQIRFWTTKVFLLSQIFWLMRMGLLFLTLNGCKMFNDFSVTKMMLTSGWIRS